MTFIPAQLTPLRIGAVALICAAVLSACALRSDDVQAARNMEIALQDDPVFVSENYFDRDRAFRFARALGVTRLRVNLGWAFTMGRAQQRSRRRPPGAPEQIYNFGSVDSLIDQAARNGIRVHLSLTGPAPAWATSNRRVGPRGPNPGHYAEFVRVVAEHFRGRVDRYSIWNEGNWYTWLAPLRKSPSIYRALYVRGYAAIKRADPAAAVLIGETAPYRQRGKSMAPIDWLRRVTCVNRRYRRVRRCTRLVADGYAHHPYDFAHAPNFRYPGRDNATMGTLRNLTRALDRLSRAGVLRRNGGGRLQLYLTEFGYFASGHRSLPARVRSRYLARGFQMALRNGRVRSQLQYLLVSPPKRFPWSFFDLGLISVRGGQYPQYRALRRWYLRNRGRVKRPGGPISLPPVPGSTPSPSPAPGGGSGGSGGSTDPGSGGGDPGGGGGGALPPILPLG